MKISQCLPINNDFWITGLTSGSYLGYQLRFDPTKFTQITSIYFEAEAEMWDAAQEAYVELWNYSTSTLICTLTFDSTTRTVKQSENIVDFLTSFAILDIKFYCKNSGTHITKYQSNLKVNQEFTTTDRKTVTYLPIYVQSSIEEGPGWNPQMYPVPTPQIDKFNGNVTVNLICRAYCTEYSAYGKFRLYDVTLDEAVANSETTFTNTTFYIFSSSALTFVADHEYAFQVYIPEEMGGLIFRDVALTITQTAFTKTAPVVDYTRAGYDSSIAGWEGAYPFNHVNPTWFSALDLLQFNVHALIEKILYAEETVSTRLYDKTAAAVITGAEHTYNGPDSADAIINDDVDLTTEADLELQFSTGLEIFGARNVTFRAWMEDNYAQQGFQYADASKPTGFTCFMSQFLKNRKAGNVPFLTADGVNRCW